MKKLTIIIIIFLALLVAGFFVFQSRIFYKFQEPTDYQRKAPMVIPAVNNNGQLASRVLEVPPKFKGGALNIPRNIELPEGLGISVFASGFGKPRAMAIFNENTIFATDRADGNLYFLKDADGDGVADEIKTIDPSLRNAHGIEIYKNDLYVGEEHQIVVYRQIDADGNYSQKQVLISNLPSGQGHVTRTVKIGPDEKIYVAIGSSCNVCQESDSRRASILRYNTDGTFDRIIAQGLRNTVDFTFVNADGKVEIWGVDNGRDRIGDNIPPEEVNVISVDNGQLPKNYGWPYCYGSGLANPEFPGRSEFCRNQTEFPRYEMQAHSAPLGMTFVPDNAKISNVFQGQLLVAFHGSWNRTTPTGYKIIRINLTDGSITDFISGWLEENGTAWGRPVDVKFSPEGVLFITDDSSGTIYKVSQNN